MEAKEESISVDASGNTSQETHLSLSIDSIENDDPLRPELVYEDIS